MDIDTCSKCHHHHCAGMGGNRYYIDCDGPSAGLLLKYNEDGDHGCTRILKAHTSANLKKRIFVICNCLERQY